MSDEPNEMKPREVLQFWGRPSDGFFKRAVVVQDAVVVEPTKEAQTLFDRILASQPFVPTTPMVVSSRAKRGLPPELDGRYGMHRTVEGHKESVCRCLRALRPVADTFDALLVTGLSGQLPAAVVAYALDKPLAVLRKTYNNSTWNTESHGTLLEGSVTMNDGTRYLILDDFISSGKTMRKLLAAVPKGHTVVGLCLYGHRLTRREVETGRAASFCTRENEVDHQWHVVRRGSHKSILFDLVPDPLAFVKEGAE